MRTLRAQRLLVVAIALVLTVVDCVTERNANYQAAAPETQPTNPLACIALGYETEKPLTFRIIQEDSILPGEILAVIQRLDVDNPLQMPPEGAGSYLNIYLTTRMTRETEEEGEPVSRYLVVELWQHNTSSEMLICHQWTIYEEEIGATPQRATLRNFVETAGGELINEMWQSVGQVEMEQLGTYYEKVRDYLLTKFENQHRGETPTT